MIRPGREDDGGAALALWAEADAAHAALAPQYFREGARDPRAWRALLVESATRVLVAEGARGGLTGFAVARVYDTPPEPALVPARRAHVEIVAVARAARRRGVGRALMDGLGAWARTRGAVELVLTVWEGNAAASAFYERLGFRPVTRSLRAPL